MHRRITNIKKGVRKILLHIVLTAGSIMFAVPFIWLASTSAKVADEMYPPRWIPQIPRKVVDSPYVQMRENERAARPLKIAEEDWDRLAPAIRSAITAHIVSIASTLPEFYGPHLKEPDIAESLFARILKRAPDEIFARQETEACAWFVANVDPAMIGDVFEDAYRRVALSNVVFHGKDVTFEQPTDTVTFPWQVESGDAELITRTEGLRRPAQEVRYSFAKNSAFRLTATLPLQMPFSNLKKVVVSNHGDRSWHNIALTLEMDGRKFESVQDAYAGTDRWQDTTWQFRSDDDDSIKMKTWLRMEEAGASAFKDPGKVKLTLEYRQARGITAMLNKYLNNYRDVLRMVPLDVYVSNSMYLVILNILGQIVGSSLVAYAFARLQWPARDFCFVLVLATLMIPPQVTMIPVFLIFKELGWYNTLKPLWIGSFFGSAFYIFLLRQFMKGIPKDLEDSAMIDGCSYFGIYRLVILPLIKPALAAIGIFTFMGTWNDFMGPLIYLNDQRLYPLSLGLFALQVFKFGDYGLMMAASVLMTLPVILLFFAAQRQFIQGVTLTGMKN